MRDWVEAARSGSYLTRDRVRGYALVLLIFELAAFAFAVAGTHGWIVPLAEPNASDFVSFYAAGTLADGQVPALAYDQAAHFASERQAVAADIPYNFFYYPPVFLLVCEALAKLPYLAGFLVLEIGCLVPCLALARRIVGPVFPSTLLAYPAVFWAVGTGQNALLTATLFAAATLAIHRRPLLAGVLLGALCYKPHLGLLIPVALVAGAQWRAIAAAILTVLSLALVSIIVFGWEPWPAFFQSITGAGGVYGMRGTGVDLAGLTNVYGLASVLGGSSTLAIGVQIPMTLGAGAAVAWIWARQTGSAAANAVLLAATPVAVPISMFYELMLTGLALAWLVRDGRDHGFPPWQQSMLALTFLLPLLSGNIGYEYQTGIPPATAALGLALAIRQAVYTMRHAGNSRRMSSIFRMPAALAP